MTPAELKRLAEEATPGPWVVAETASYLTIRGERPSFCLGNRVPVHVAAITKPPAYAPRNAAYIAAANPARVLHLIEENEAWTWLAENPALSIETVRSEVEGDPDLWCVHRASGGVNDREWERIAIAPTPLEAVSQARQALGGQSHE